MSVPRLPEVGLLSCDLFPPEDPQLVLLVHSQQRKFFRDDDDEEDSDEDDWLDEEEEYVSPIDDVDAFIFFADAMKSECCLLGTCPPGLMSFTNFWRDMWG